MNERLLAVIAAVLAAIVLGVAVYWQPEVTRPAPVASPLPPGGDFTLDSADGPVALADYRGKLVLLYFGYTYCPDICPTSLAITAEALGRLSDAERARVATLFVSVDPARDTPARLKDYVQFFHPSMIGLTGTPESLAEIARRYSVFYAMQPAETAGGGYVVDHSAETFIVGSKGNLLARIAHGTPPDQVVALVRQYLNQP